MTMCAGGTPSTDSATSRGDAFSVRARRAPAPRRASASGADPNRRSRANRSSRDAAIDQLALRRAGAHDHRARRRVRELPQQQRVPSSPAIRRRRQRSAMTTIDAPAAVDTSVLPTLASRILRPARPARCRAPCLRRRGRAVVDEPDDRDDVAPRQRVRERTAELARADDGDLLHRGAHIVMADAID